MATKGPILTRLDCDNTWMNAKNTGGRLDAYDAMSMQGGHAVALVGYDPNQFIVRNSWGTTQWGDKGFGYASNAYAAAAFTEGYGAECRLSTPLVSVGVASRQDVRVTQTERRSFARPAAR